MGSIIRRFAVQDGLAISFRAYLKNKKNKSAGGVWLKW
jgi:hypothetical protein